MRINYQKTFTNIGIYKITSPTNKVYIGQSWVLYHRFIFYKNMVKNQEDDQRKLFNSVAKHGWENHTFEVLMYLKSDTTQEWMDYWEIFFWKYYKDEENCEMLNLKEPGSHGRHSEETKAKLRGPASPELRLRKIAILDKARAEGKTTKGYKHSDESRRKMSEARKGGALAGPNNGMWGKKLPMSAVLKKSVPIIQYDLEGNKLKEWISATDAARQLGFFSSGIQGCCRDRQKTYKGFLWKYKDETRGKDPL